MTVQAIKLRDIEDAIAKWVETSTGIAHTWEDQTAPQLPYPYAHSNILPGSSPIPARGEQRIKPDGSILVYNNRDFTVSTAIDVGPPDATKPECHAGTLIETMLAYLDTPVQREDFRQVGLAIRERMQPLPLDLLVGSQWISRTSIDIRFGVASNLEGIPATTPGFFDKVEVSSTISGFVNPSSSLDLDKELIDPNA